MTHRASPKFWVCYRQLPEDVRRLADESYRLIQRDPKHPSLHFKKLGRFWSVRIGLHYRAIAVERDNVLVWFWVGPHAIYNRLIAGKWAPIDRGREYAAASECATRTKGMARRTLRVVQRSAEYPSEAVALGSWLR